MAGIASIPLDTSSVLGNSADFTSVSMKSVTADPLLREYLSPTALVTILISDELDINLTTSYFLSAASFFWTIILRFLLL
jgi:hypothetical protein